MMADQVDKYSIHFKAPVLPTPPREYIGGYFNTLNNILRLYFSQLDTYAQELTTDLAVSYTTSTGDVTLARVRRQVAFANAAGTTTIDLPPTPSNSDQITIKNVNTGTCTIDGNGKNIDGAATKALAQWDALHLLYSSTLGKWLIV
jgi:hypothetical protein